MRRRSLKSGVALWLVAMGVCGFLCDVVRAQQTSQSNSQPTPERISQATTIDRIVARVETDIILLSDVRALERYQQLVDGKSESDTQVLDRLIDQWVVRNEAETAQFPQPTPDSIDKGVERVQK